MVFKQARVTYSDISGIYHFNFHPKIPDVHE